MMKLNWRKISGAILLICPVMLAMLYVVPSWETFGLFLAGAATLFSMISGGIMLIG